jgi:hypothetical protein
MKIIFVIVLSIISFNVFSSENNSLASRAIFPSIEKAKELMTTEDQFTTSWSKFDIDIRLHKINSKKADLIKCISAQVLEWSEDEKQKIIVVLQGIDTSISNQGLKINFQKDIYFIKSTNLCEGRAEGYTRANYVILKNDVASKSMNDLKQLVIHELFHVFSRNDSLFRRKMYNVIGFEICNSISYPDNIKDYKLTDPDATQTDSYIKLKRNDKEIECMMILYSKFDYNGGDSFSKYLSVGFLKLKGKTRKEIEYIDNKPVIYAYNDVSNFIEQVGSNTKYLVHPEEILASNFVFVINNSKGLPSQEIVDKMQEKLKE